MFSDGYQDQFGGEEGKKFMRKAFVRLLTSVANHPQKTQESQLRTTLENWKGKQTQTDDILVMGLGI